MATLPDPLGVHAPAARRLTVEHVTARALVEASSFAEAAPKILQAICESFGWEHGALWTVDRELDVLRCGDIWTTPGQRFDEFDAISRQLTFPRGVGLPGRVWATGEPVWIADVVRDANFPRAAVAARDGLHAALGFPVLLHGDVLSVMEFFSVEIRTPDEELLSMLSSVGSQIGLFFARRRAQDDLDRFFTLSLDMLCIAGFDGYFKRVNPAWQRILGYTEEELLSRPYMEFTHPDDRNATGKEASKLSTGEEVVYFENRYLHKDGTLRWLLWTSTPYPELQVMYAAARDITERKAAEETLAQYALDLGASHRALEDQAARLAQLVRELETARRRAEEAVEVKSAFLANMSHEIRTPLNAILGMTTLALQTRLTADQRDYMATVKSSAESLLAIINDILDFSKIEAQRLELDRAEFDLRDAVGHAAKLLAVRAAEKGIELACHVAADVPERVVGDEGRLRQVLLNVMGNAVKFTHAGEVVVHVTVEQADERRARLHFVVTDTGIGIPQDKQAQIFQAFTQADSSTTRRYGGTGLGLAIALRLVELMAGRLWVESEVGRGSTFHFTAAFDVPRETVLSGAVQRKALEGLRVLVVDDNATNRRILDEMLTSWRMRPTVVNDAKRALATLRGAVDGPGRFDVLISDCQMPDVDGFTLARQVKRDEALATTPVVLLTSIASPRDIDRCRKLGVEGYLSKPITHSDLLDALVTAFGVSTRLPASAKAAPTRVRPLRILVAEDNLVNRKLVTRLLQKRGHRIVAVDNGRAALDAATSATGRRFDVVLMDVQMPEMNGLEATVAIRQREQGSDRHVPIVALTAHAMPADRERCLAAGMDNYLAKPIDVDELIAIVEGYALGPAPPPMPARIATAPTAAAQPVFDEAAALAHAGGDRRLLAEVVAFFRADSPAALRRVDRAVTRADPEALRLAAHALKGVLATVGSPAGRDLAASLEQVARSGSLAPATALAASLRATIVALNRAFVSAGLVSPPRRRSARTSAPRSASKNRRVHDKDSRRRR